MREVLPTDGANLSQPKMGDYQTTRLLVSCVSDRNGLAHNDLRDSDWFGPKTPYVQYGGWFSHSIARAQMLKISEGSLQAFKQ